MASFTYTAKREIQAGHVSGEDYVITIDLQAYSGGLPTRVGARNVALSGAEVNVLHRLEYQHAIVTDYVPRSGGVPSAADMLEFLASVSGGEPFTFDDGTASRLVKLLGSASRSDVGIFYQYNFTLVRVA